MRIVWSPSARRDLERVRDYIALHRPLAAAKIAALLVEHVESLCSFPSIGRPGRVPGTRELVVSETPFLIPYRVEDDRVEIIAVLHGARRWPD